MQAQLSIALLQCNPLVLDTAANLARLEQAAVDSKEAGADMLVTPEMFLTGYNIGAAQVTTLAEAADGAMAQAVADIAIRQGIAIVYGYPERGGDGAVYNAAQCIDEHGRTLLNYRKTHLFGALDRAQFTAGTPQQNALFDYRSWRLGVLICYDLEFPENARRLALAGADAILVPTANMPDYDFVAQAMLPTRAYENQLYVAYANYIGSESGLRYGGLSGLAAPDGRLTAQAGRHDTLLPARLDAAVLADVRARHHHLAEQRERG